MAMASSSCTAVTEPLKKYDVFISFRGEDTRSGFTSHLHSALCRRKVQTYIDYRIEKGKQVWAELEKAIKDSNIFVVVFSENYASSTWCLNELLEIIECRKNGQDDVDVIPVFYHVDPSHVRKQTGSYQIALAKHKKQSEDKIQKWKNALFEAANLSGFHSSAYGTESNLIEGIIKAVLGKLDHEYTNEPRCHFIPDENYWHIESSIKIDTSEVQIIGLWGMGGIGKTTLAEVVFSKVRSQYEGSHFFENVTELSERHGLNCTRNKLLPRLLMEEDLGIDTSKVTPSMVMRQLKRMKVFIVLDDVRTSKLLQNLIGEGRGWLGAGSTIIVTTRDKHVLKSGGVDKIYKVKEMNSRNSLQLFSMNAFKKVLPDEGYVELSKKAIDYAKGNPLALKVLGSFLHDKSEIEWDSALAKLKEIPNVEIQKVLRWSYNELDDKERKIFLDIACFLKGHEKGRVIKILNECGFFADIGIRHLLDKALLRVDLENCIQMHDLIEEMGKQIVHEESPKNPGRRSRLWGHKEVCDVLTNNRGTEAVEAIFLDLAQITNMKLSSQAFRMMPNTRLLAFQDHKGNKSVSLPNGLKLLPESLRYFLWDGYPLKSLPATFCPEMLVELRMPDSKVEKLWNGVQNLPKLEILNLSGSKRLIECPNVSGCPDLKIVLLRHCGSLPHVDSSIFSLQKLEYLNLRGCKSLKSLSSNTCSPSLQTLIALDCINLREFSVVLMPNIASIDRLTLAFGVSGLNELPSSILHTKNLKAFWSHISDKLVDLPENFTHTICLFNPLERECDTSITLRKVLLSPAFLSVKRLSIGLCNSLFEIPDNISSLSSLESLSLYNNAIISLPETIKYLPRLKRLQVVECKMLQSIPVLPQSIKFLRLWKCESLEIVLSSMSESSEESECCFMLLNCIKLDPYSFLKDIIVGIGHRARLHSATSENVRDLFTCFLPAISDNIRYWFPCHYPQALVTVELPPNLLGFVYYLVLSKGDMSLDVGFGCECHLETSSGERIIITSFSKGEYSRLFVGYDDDDSIDMTSDHVRLWFDAQCCKQILKAVEERKAIIDVGTSYNPELTFRFFIDETQCDEVEIKECGFRWIYPTEDQIVLEEGGRCKSKRSTEIFELEANAVKNRADRSESDEQNLMGKKKQFLQQRNSSNVSLELCPTMNQVVTVPVEVKRKMPNKANDSHEASVGCISIYSLVKRLRNKSFFNQAKKSL